MEAILQFLPSRKLVIRRVMIHSSIHFLFFLLLSLSSSTTSTSHPLSCLPTCPRDVFIEQLTVFAKEENLVSGDWNGGDEKRLD
eukprot:492319-Hanusia_phi.AAC.1